PGTRNFCPMVFRTDALDAFQALELAAKAQETIDEVASDILSRTAAFLLLKDSKSSFAIENEKPPEERIQRWGRAIGEAGRNPTDFDELLRLQEIVIGDSRFVSLGLRTEGGFVGEHDRDTRMPVPDHISAKPEDLASLIDGLCEFEQGAALDLDPIVAAAILAFGFVYVHPFGDGNGRIHRYLVHHILAKRGFNPAGIVFPVSAAIQDRIDEYREVLESYSKRLLPCIQWTPTSEGNVSVENETADLYRFFDATPHAEFLYSCAKRTIEIDLPDETAFLTSFDRFSVGVDAMLEMSNVTKDLLFRFLHQNSGKLSKRAKSKEFASLGEDEIAAVEALYNECFE
ncbi:MAG: Fic family protein, partial [Gammaproteobacteria bacterium]|nr:Fic family protein [Gammaproteobacteria bacterium]